MQVKIKQEGLNVILEFSDGKYISFPYSAAKIIGRELMAAGLQSEEIAKAAQIAQDQAILIRSGFPIGITSNKAIMKEAIKRAEELKIPNAPPITKLPRLLQIG